MAKKKIVVKVTMTNEKKTRKAFEIAAKFCGVDSVTLVPDKAQIAVIGEGIDSVQLTSKLRKSVGPTDIVSVGPVEEKKPEKPPATTPVTFDIHYPPQYPYDHVHLMPMHVVHEDPFRTCNIL